MRLYGEKAVWRAFDAKLSEMSQKEAAAGIGISPQRLSKALRESRMTARMARWVGFDLKSTEVRRLYERRSAQG